MQSSHLKASPCPFSDAFFRNASPLYSEIHPQGTKLPASHCHGEIGGGRGCSLNSPPSHLAGQYLSSESPEPPEAVVSSLGTATPAFGGQSPRSLQPQSWKHQVPIWGCLSGDLEFVMCVCVWLMWVYGFSFILVYIRGKWVPPTCRQCVFIDFSKAFPNDVGNFWCFWSSQDSHTVSHLTCPPSVTTLGVDVPLWTHGSSPPPLSINVGLEYASLLQNSAKFLFPPWCWNILCKRAGGVVKMARRTQFQISGKEPVVEI